MILPPCSHLFPLLSFLSFFPFLLLCPNRYGKEEKLVHLFGIMQVLVSFVQDNKDSLRYEEKVQGKTPLNSSTRTTARNYLIMLQSDSVWESVCMHPLLSLH